MQYKSHESAKKALKNLCDEWQVEHRIVRTGGEILSPAESWLLNILYRASIRRKKHKTIVAGRTLSTMDNSDLWGDGIISGDRYYKYRLPLVGDNYQSYWDSDDEKRFRRVKSIARGLNLFPFPEWTESYLKMVERMDL